jgi:hypothetical protein
MRSSLILTFTALSTTAHADPQDVAVTDDARTALAESAVPTALGLAALASGDGLLANSSAANDHGVVGVSLVAGGAAALVVGPALGHLHAGDGWKAGVVRRTIATGVMAAGMAVLYQCDRTFDLDLATGTGSCSAPVGVGLALTLGGAIWLVADAIHDTATAPRAARRTARDRGIGIVPTLAPVSAATGTVPGLGVVGRS